MGRLRHRLLGWACLTLVAMNVTAVICGGSPGSAARMPCCMALDDDNTLPTLEPCCAPEQRQQADPAGTANVAAAQPAADASTLLDGLVAPRTPALLNHYPLRDRIGSPPDTYLLLSVFLI